MKQTIVNTFAFDFANGPSLKISTEITVDKKTYLFKKKSAFSIKI